MQTHLPEGVPLFRKKLEILVSKLQRWESVEFQVCPRVKKGSQVDKCVQTQPIVAIVGQVGHENTDLKNREGKKKTSRKKYVLFVFYILILRPPCWKIKEGRVNCSDCGKQRSLLISGAVSIIYSAANLCPLVISKLILCRLTRVKPEGVCLQEQGFMGYTRSRDMSLCAADQGTVDLT